jgi:hypothetical protein
MALRGGTPKEAEAAAFWRRVMEADALEWSLYDGTPDGLADGLSRRYGFPPVRFWRWGLLDERELLMPPPHAAMTIALTAGLSVTEAQRLCRTSVPPQSGLHAV